MSETQLREAFALMKEGNKNEALRLVQQVLRDDKRNIGAWWLLTHLIDDEDKLVKALENVLSLNPDHTGARKRLASLRPEYAHLYEEDEVKNKNGHQADSYWEKIDNPTKRRQMRISLSDGQQGWAIYGFAAVIVIGMIFVFSTMSYLGNVDVPDESEVSDSILANTANTPESVARAFLEAYYHESATALYQLTCPDYHPEIDEMVAEFDDAWAWQTTFDFSQTTFEIDPNNSGEDYAFVNFHGVTVIEDGGINIRTDWDEVARSNGYDNWGYYLEKIDGQWLVCTN